MSGQASLPLFPVRFIPASEESGKSYTIHCVAMPRVGDRFVPESGETMLVSEVRHKVVKNTITELPEWICIPHAILVPEKQA